MTVSRIIAVAAACAVTGCGTILHGPRQLVPVQSAPTGATVTATPADGGPVTTPGSLDLERKNSYVLTFTSPGYSTAPTPTKEATPSSSPVATSAPSTGNGSLPETFTIKQFIAWLETKTGSANAKRFAEAFASRVHARDFN